MEGSNAEVTSFSIYLAAICFEETLWVERSGVGFVVVVTYSIINWTKPGLYWLEDAFLVGMVVGIAAVVADGGGERPFLKSCGRSIFDCTVPLVRSNVHQARLGTPSRSAFGRNNDAGHGAALADDWGNYWSRRSRPSQSSRDTGNGPLAEAASKQ